MEHVTHRGASAPGKPLITPCNARAELATGNGVTAMASLTQYKAWADTELLNAVLALPQLETVQEGRYVAAVVRHFHTVDCIFKAHLLGVAHGYDSVNPSEPAALAELRPRVAEIDQWYVAYTRGLREDDLSQALCVRFTDGQERVLTRSEILLHVSLHGAYHRGNIGVLLQLRGDRAPPDGFASFLGAASTRPSP